MTPSKSAMDELNKRLNALYLVVDAPVANDIRKHVLAALDEAAQERDAYRKRFEFASEVAKRNEAEVERLRAGIAEAQKQKGDAALFGLSERDALRARLARMEALLKRTQERDWDWDLLSRDSGMRMAQQFRRDVQAALDEKEG